VGELAIFLRMRDTE